MKELFIYSLLLFNLAEYNPINESIKKPEEIKPENKLERVIEKEKPLEVPSEKKRDQERERRIINNIEELEYQRYVNIA